MNIVYSNYTVRMATATGSLCITRWQSLFSGYGAEECGRQRVNMIGKFRRGQSGPTLFCPNREASSRRCGAFTSARRVTQQPFIAWLSLFSPCQLQSTTWSTLEIKIKGYISLLIGTRRKGGYTSLVSDH